jgi:hypothetical protein
MLHQIMRHGHKHFQRFPGDDKTSMQHECDMDRGVVDSFGYG